MKMPLRSTHTIVIQSSALAEEQPRREMIIFLALHGAVLRSFDCRQIRCWVLVLRFIPELVASQGVLFTCVMHIERRMLTAKERCWVPSSAVFLLSTRKHSASSPPLPPRADFVLALK